MTLFHSSFAFVNILELNDFKA